MATQYRIVKYEGPEEWLDKQLDNSMPQGVKEMGPLTSISVAAIDPEDNISIELCRDKFRRLIAKLESKGEIDIEKGFT